MTSRRLIVVVVVIGLAVLPWFFLFLSARNHAHRVGAVTSHNAARIKAGLTEAEVSTLLGYEGAIQNHDGGKYARVWASDGLFVVVGFDDQGLVEDIIVNDLAEYESSFLQAVRRVLGL